MTSPARLDPVATDPAAPATDPGLTVDELAARTGVSVRTLRFYAAEGLLPPPARRGRQAIYGEGHRLRLELIRTLVEHGYTLAAVARTVSRIPDTAPAEVYAAQAAVLSPWLSEEDGEQLDRAGLSARAGRELSDEQVGSLIRIGAISPAGAGYRVRATSFGQAVRLLDLPVPATVMRESVAVIETHAEAVAQRLTDLFADLVWAPYRRGEIADTDLVDILGALRPLALSAMVSALGRAADRTARDRAERTPTPPT